jgi:hypothetical protein
MDLTTLKKLSVQIADGRIDPGRAPARARAAQPSITASKS